MEYQEQSQKAQSGADFNKRVLDELKRIHALGLIQSIEMMKKYPFERGFEPQFHAPFLVTRGEKSFLIFKTNSARSDRIKENQWDAYGVKNYFKEEIKALLVLPDGLSDSEKKHAAKERKKIKQECFFSKIDEILFLSELESFFKTA